MIDIKSKKAVFFDFGDTLASTVPSYPDRIRLALIEMGFNITEKQYFSAFQCADYTIYKEYIQEQNISSSIYQNKLFSILLYELGIKIDIKEARTQIKQKLAKSKFTRQLLPGAKELLKGLSASGYRLSVISNNDGKTAEKCEEVGIAGYLELIIDSTNVKKIKPDKDIFLLASGRLGIDIKDILYIGDLYGADVMGATNAGIDVIWVNHKEGVNYEGIDITEVKDLFELSKLFQLS